MDYCLKRRALSCMASREPANSGSLHPRHNLMCHKRAAGSRFSKLRHIQKRARHGTVLPVEGTHDSARTGQPNSGSVAPRHDTHVPQTSRGVTFLSRGTSKSGRGTVPCCQLRGHTTVRVRAA